MRLNMKTLAAFLLILFPLSLYSQEDQTSETRLKLFAGISYHFHSMDFYYYDGSTSRESHFFGSEFGFSLRPKEQDGIYVEFRNLLLGDLLVREIYRMAGSEKYSYATDYTISSGFFGRLDLGRRWGGNNHIGAGFLISDKYVSGINGNFYIYDKSTYGEIEGFHLTPGIYTEYLAPLGTKNDFIANVSVQQSVFNFWQIGHTQKYLYPLFIETSLGLQNHTGVFLKLSSILMVPYQRYDPEYRLSLTLGYNFSL